MYKKQLWSLQVTVQENKNISSPLLTALQTILMDVTVPQDTKQTNDRMFSFSDFTHKLSLAGILQDIVISEKTDKEVWSVQNIEAKQVLLCKGGSGEHGESCCVTACQI